MTLASWAEPIVALVMIGLLVLGLRWCFRPHRSLVARPPRVGAPDEYGLLVAVAEPRDEADGVRLAEVLRRAEIRATVVHTSAGLRVMVWRADERRARSLLKRAA